MSKIGNQPIKIPAGVEVKSEKHYVVVKGPGGELQVRVPSGITVTQKEDQVVVARDSDERQSKANHGLIRSLVNNAVVGVSEGFKKTLELSGVGFRAALSQDKLVLSIGFSHPVEVEKPEGVNFTVSENKITISGASKELVGDVASKIRKLRPPEPYKGKGIKYEGEIVRRKAGKAQAATTS